MWDADVWGEGSDPVFLSAMVAQAEAFARAVRGGERQGAGGPDAVAALDVAERVAEALTAAAERARSPLAPAS
jgi:predicted dehydrogenase